MFHNKKTCKTRMFDIFFLSTKNGLFKYNISVNEENLSKSTKNGCYLNANLCNAVNVYIFVKSVIAII